MENYKLDDTTIMQIVRLIQMGMLTGTDVADQLRTLQLSINEETQTLVPAPEYADQFDENVSKLVEMAESSTSE